MNMYFYLYIVYIKKEYINYKGIKLKRHDLLYFNLHRQWKRD